MGAGPDGAFLAAPVKVRKPKWWVPDDMNRLTHRNRRAIDLYLGADPKYRGNGTACWQESYGTRKPETAAAAWARMLSGVKAREYLERRQREIEVAVTEKVVYDTQRAVADLLSVQREAMELDENGRMRDRRAAIQATVEALKVQGKYVTHSESTSVQVTTEDRMRAKVLGLSLNEYVRRKQAGTLPALPEIVTAK